MRILFWNETYLPVMGGTERMTHHLAAGLRARGHEVAVVADSGVRALPPAETIDGIAVHRFPFFSAITALGTGDAEALSRLSAIERDVSHVKAEFRPDIVHVNLAGANALFHLRTAASWPARTIVMLQAPLSAQAALSPVVRQLVASASHLVAPSETAAKHFADQLDQGRAVEAIFPGVKSLGIERSPASFTDHPRRIVALGRLVRDKGFDLAIRAMSLLRGQARLTIIGEGPAEAELRVLVDQLKLGGMVKLAGRLEDSDLRRELSLACAMVVPSRHIEFFGMVAAEAALSGLPVVASRVGGLAEVVVDGETGLTVPPDDPESLATALRRLCADPALAMAMGARARDRARRLFTSEHLIERFETLYQASCVERDLTTDR